MTTQPTIPCAWCGEAFTPSRAGQKYDRAMCRYRARHSRAKSARDVVSGLPAASIPPQSSPRTSEKHASIPNPEPPRAQPLPASSRYGSTGHRRTDWVDGMLAHVDLDDEARDTLEHEMADQARDRADAAAYARGEAPALEPVDIAKLWKRVANAKARKRRRRSPPA